MTGTATRAAETYRRVLVTKHGGPDVLEIGTAPIEAPRRGKVRVRILAAGVAFADILMRYGVYPGTPKPPFVPGYDIAGIVDAVGPCVSSCSVGDTVVALTVRGGYASRSSCQPGSSWPRRWASTLQRWSASF